MKSNTIFKILFFSCLQSVIINLKAGSFFIPHNDSAVFVEPTLGYIADAGRNFSGGIKKGNAFMGLAYGGLLIHSDKFWKGGEFVIEIMNTHGHRLSSNYIGDIQVVSNIENGNYTFFYQMYYKQRFNKGYIIAGVHDLNTEFAVGEYGASLTNSSFGIQSTIALNFPVSLYPKNALALLFNYRFNRTITFRAGIYDSDAGSLQDDPHNLNWTLDGMMSIGEIEFHSERYISTIIRTGAYYLTEKYSDPSDTNKISNGNYGIYFLADQKLLDLDVRGLGVFAQLGYAPKDRNFNTFYAGFGLNIFAPLKHRASDIVAFGLAYARLFDDSYECDIEINYTFVLNKYISLQPAVHYVINPGSNLGFDNAFAGIIRISAGF